MKQNFSFRILPPPATAGEAENEIMWILVATDEKSKLDLVRAIIKGASWKEKDLGKMLIKHRFVLNILKYSGEWYSTQNYSTVFRSTRI